ncbi:MAG: class I SAM-dependent methyltransferase, partial [Synechococcaceae bacterium WB6_3B_236]|nr:class I SAM-dependent methyltransferase [Synechococcaceae bacterium WB6_3B_236]
MGDTSSVAGYDDRAQRQIPGYASLARLAVALLASSPTAVTPGAAVLVVGCGTGAELSEARAQRPDWRLSAVDPSAAMISAARQRLGVDAEAVQWWEGPAEDLGGEARFAGAIAVLVLQEVADDGSKLRLLTALARLLAPGAPLVLVDLMGNAPSVGSSLENQFQAAQAQFQRASGLDTDAPQALVYPIGEARRSALLAAAGFSDPVRIFQALGYEGVLVQRR